MSTVLLVLVVVLVVAGLVYGVVSLLTGDDPGLAPVDPDGVARPLPNNRSLSESDLKTVRFDVELRGYRMSQVDRVLRRTAYDVGYKDEMIAVLEAEVIALREGRLEDAELLRKARETASSTAPPPVPADTAAGTQPAADVDEAQFEVIELGVVEVTPDDPVEAFPYVDTGAGRLNRAALRRVDDEPDLQAPGSNGAVGPDVDGPRLRADDGSTAADGADDDAGTGEHGDLVSDIDAETGAADDADSDVGDEDGAAADVDEDSGELEVEAGAPARRGGRA